MKNKILVVDDDASIVEGIKLVLETEEYSVCTTTKAEKVQEMIKECRPDLIILDIMLVGYDGRIIAKGLKQDKTTKDIPILMISASHDMEKTIYEYGADDFLAKPFDIDHLIHSVKEQINKSGQKQEIKI